MKKQFLKIVSTAAALTAALTFSLNSASAYSSTTTADTVVVTEEMLEKHSEYIEAYNNAYDKALKEEMSDIEEAVAKAQNKTERGEYTEDPHSVRRKIAEEKAKAECEKLSLSSNSFKLTAYENSVWPGWHESFVLPSDVGSNSLTFFNPPNFFKCYTNGGYASITPIEGYKGNLKSVRIDITYTDGTTDYSYKKGNESSVNTYVTGSANKKIERATYRFTLYEGDTVAADIKEYAIITLISG